MIKAIALITALVTSSAFAAQSLAHSQHCKDTELGSLMKQINTELKAYVNAYKAKDQNSMLQSAVTLVANAQKAKTFIPLKLQNGDHPMAQMDHGTIVHDMKDMKDMKDMDHSNMANMKDMAGMDHSNMADMKDMVGMDHSNMANMKDMAGMDHSNMADMKDMTGMDHSNMADMKDMTGMDHQTHMQHMGYLQGIDKLEELFTQLQQTTDRDAIKGLLGQIKQHSKLSHKEYRMDCD
jgi:E3 ubiquitin-protein ligase DOA10